MFECLIHGLVDDGLSPHVDVGSGLIHKDYLSRLENGPGDADQLTLTHRQVLTVFGDLCLETLSLAESLIQGAQPQGAGELLVGVFLKGIQVLHRERNTSRMVPANRQGSCRMMVILERRSSKLN
jgi:hypothetical protein